MTIDLPKKVQWRIQGGALGASAPPAESMVEKS